MERPLSNEDISHIRAMYTASGKIAAIRLYRELSGAGLAEAKQAVEALGAGGSAAELGSISSDSAEQIEAALFAGKKIQAIKVYRTATNIGLKEAKEFVEALEAELRRTEPERFTAPAAKGCGAAALVLLVAIVVLIGFAVA